MAAIIRVKRRLDEDPADNLIIQYKRSRTDGSEADETAKLCLSLATTVKSKDAALSRPLRKDKEQIQTSYKSHNSKRLVQTRAENTALRKASRYKIVNSRRAASGDLNEAGAESPAPEESKESAEPQAVSGLDQAASSDSDTRTSASSSSPESAGAGCSEGYEPVIHDVEVYGESVEDVLPGMAPSGITLNGQPLISRPTFSTAESNYVYDLYYTHQSDPSYTFRDIENILSIEALHNTMLTDADRMQECEEVYDDEDNSNDEDNWRNQYPDRDPDAPSSSGDSDVEHEDDFLEGKESCAYRSSVKDNMLVEALGSKLQIFGSDDSSRSGDESDEEDAYKDDDDDNPYRLVSSYKAPIRPMKEDLGVKDGDWDDNYF
ncbi:hypothetical protein ACOMHN_052325 [Nucella lapillus]